MKAPWILILSLCGMFSFAQENYPTNKDFLVWKKDFKLSWDSYRGQPDSTLTKDYEAVTYFSFVPVGKVPSVQVLCIFDSNKSWVTNKNTSNLIHQQLHFDIGELFARKIRRDIDLLKQGNQLTERAVLDTIERNYLAYSKMFDQYNDETLHGGSKIEQATWQAKIRDELQELFEYQTLN